MIFRKCSHYSGKSKPPSGNFFFIDIPSANDLQGFLTAEYEECSHCFASSGKDLVKLKSIKTGTYMQYMVYYPSPRYPDIFTKKKKKKKKSPYIDRDRNTNCRVYTGVILPWNALWDGSPFLSEPGGGRKPFCPVDSDPKTALIFGGTLGGVTSLSTPSSLCVISRWRRYLPCREFIPRWWQCWQWFIALLSYNILSSPFGTLPPGRSCRGKHRKPPEMLLQCYPGGVVSENLPKNAWKRPSRGCGTVKSPDLKKFWEKSKNPRFTPGVFSLGPCEWFSFRLNGGFPLFINRLRHPSGRMSEFFTLPNCV